ncbi:MAG: ATP-binding protein, partial [Bacillota bacterium]|nr:ATP-binding protein [Bacillota bacterium]
PRFCPHPQLGKFFCNFVRFYYAINIELEHARSILSELGLATASELLDAKLEDAMHKEATYLGFCSEIINDEIQEKSLRSEETRIKLSRLPHRETLEEFDFSQQILWRLGRAYE